MTTVNKPSSLNQNSSGSGLDWVVINSNTTAVDFKGYLIDASGNDVTLTLPVSPSEGDIVGVCDYTDSAETNTITIARNGNKIESESEDLIIDINGSGITLVYSDATIGWKLVSEVAQNFPIIVSYSDSTSDILITDLIPAGYCLESILFSETIGNNIVINIGSTNGGTDILYNEKLSGNEFELYIFNRFFSSSVTQTIDINSSNWNSASLDITIKLSPISQ